MELALDEEDLPATAATRRMGLPSTVQPAQPQPAAPILPEGPPPEAQPRSLTSEPRSLAPGSPAPVPAAEPAPEEPPNQPVEPE